MNHYTMHEINKRRKAVEDEMSGILDQLLTLDLPAALRPMLIKTVHDHYELVIRDLDTQKTVIEYLTATKEKR